MPAAKGQKYKETGDRALKAREAHRAKACKKAGVETFDELVAKVRDLTERLLPIKEISKQLNIGKDLIDAIRREYDIAPPDRIAVTKKSNLEKYGVENVMEHNDIKQKHQEVVREVWSEHKDEILDKRRETNLATGGHVCSFQTIQSKQTMVDRYGENYRSVFYHKVAERNGGINPLFSPEAIQRNRLAMEKVNRWKSKGEFEIIESLQQLGVSCKHGDRQLLNGKEIDILLHEFNLGIEFNGVWAHSEARGKTRWDHHKKFSDCMTLGVKLLTIWDFEWCSRKKQVLNFIKPLIGITTKIHARKCHVGLLSNRQANEFINNNHIQPLDARFIRQAFGLYRDNELISVMTFGIHHRNNTDVVLNRFCTMDGITVVGGASKLFTFARKTMGFKRCVSWSDNRWSWGNVYDKLGFVLEEEFSPDYFYLDKSGKVLQKQQCTKTKLGASVGQTEYQRAIELGMTRVWDCGKVRWGWDQ